MGVQSPCISRHSRERRLHGLRDKVDNQSGHWPAQSTPSLGTTANQQQQQQPPYLSPETDPPLTFEAAASLGMGQAGTGSRVLPSPLPNGYGKPGKHTSSHITSRPLQPPPLPSRAATSLGGAGVVNVCNTSGRGPPPPIPLAPSSAIPMGTTNLPSASQGHHHIHHPLPPPPSHPHHSSSILPPSSSLPRPASAAANIPTRSRPPPPPPPQPPPSIPPPPPPNLAAAVASGVLIPSSPTPLLPQLLPSSMAPIALPTSPSGQPPILPPPGPMVNAPLPHHHRHLVDGLTLLEVDDEDDDWC